MGLRVEHLFGVRPTGRHEEKQGPHVDASLGHPLGDRRQVVDVVFADGGADLGQKAQLVGVLHDAHRAVKRSAHTSESVMDVGGGAVEADVHGEQWQVVGDKREPFPHGQRRATGGEAECQQLWGFHVDLRGRPEYPIGPITRR